MRPLARSLRIRLARTLALLGVLRDRGSRGLAARRTADRSSCSPRPASSTASSRRTSRRASRRRPTDGAARRRRRAQHAGRQPGRHAADHRRVPRGRRCPSIVWVAPVGRPGGERRHVHHARRRTSRTWRPGRNIGAASPVSGDGSATSRARSARRSATTRSPTSPSIAEARGRPVDWAVTTVNEARVLHRDRGGRRRRRRRHRGDRSTRCSRRPTARR